MAFLQGMGYKLDIVFVIDSTGSMGPIINEVKSNALTLGDRLKEGLEAESKMVSEMRVKVVDFADYASEGDEAIRQTEFFSLPDQKAQFEAAVNGINIDMRGGDIPENGLEALYSAMCADWVKIRPGEKGRHIIIVMSDAVPLHLHERDGSIGYPSEDIPADVAALESIWSEKDAQAASTELNPNAKRLILFVPEGRDAAGHTWDTLATWENTVLNPINPAAGLGEIDLDDIIKEVVRSF